MQRRALLATAAEIESDHYAPAYVVGIGASAGGLEALEQFVEQLPPDSDMAFVVVQHLSPDFKSLMGEILSRRTNLPVKLVEDGMSVEPNQIYLIPSKKELIIAHGRLLLSDRNDHQDLSLPIDVFFRSLAHDCGQRAVAIVLSGSGSDGSRGICDVHDAGGLILVQDPESSQFDGMPKAAHDAGVADYVLSPGEMPRVLLEHAKRPPASGSGVSGAPLGMTAIYRMLEKEFGIDFTDYKPSTITRRIERRLQLSRAQHIDEYVQRLLQEHDELDTLYRDLLIGVTHFFRNPEAFNALQERVLPDLWRALPQSAPFRVWVAGCATGEEVYSLAILLHELGQSLGERPVKIFATDVHHGSLELATRALYEEQAMANVSAERLERYFLRRGDSYQVAPEIRQMVVFAAHNVTKDAPFTRVDLVTCRNLLIYLQPTAQQRVLSLFHFALKRGGVLFLGPSESPGAQLQDFETLDKHWRIFTKHSDSRIQVDLQRSQLGVKHQARASAAITRASTAARQSASQLLSVYDTLLEQFVPPSLLVNDNNELVHAFGGASRFLKLQDGRQILDILELVDGDLKTLLTAGLKRCRKAQEPLVFRGVRLSETDSAQLSKVTLRPIKSRGAGTPHILISIEVAADGQSERPRAAQVELDVSQISHERMGSLEEELKYTKENLQAVTEALETSNEELQATNEELLASNEELQSTNEELQSVNEELYSVNAEYQRKIGDLTELANDMENLLASTDIGTVFLDAELRIRNFTARAADSFNFLPQDIGRPVETFSHSVDYPELAHDLKQVLSSGVPVEKELHDRHGKALFARVLPYRAKGAVDGVVLTLIDVSGLKAAEDALFHERYLLNSLLSNVMDAIYFKDGRGRFIRTNHAMALRLSLSDPREAVGKTGFELPGHAQALAVHQQDDVVLRSGVAEHYRLQRREDSDGSAGWDLVTRLPLFDATNQVVGIIGIFRDVTEQKRAEDKIQEAVRRRDEFLAMLSHELRNPLAAVVSATALLRHESVGAERKRALIDVLKRQSEQMSRLLDDLLEVSRVTQDKIELRSRVLDLKPVVEEAVSAVAGLLESRDIELRLELEAGPLYVEGDPARLQQIQVNLLTNAAKYTQRGGHVLLQVKREGAQIVLTVRDDGMGIPKHMLHEVFDLFVQSKRTLERAEGGLGVGLTLVRGLVTKHGGQISAHSEGEGKGSEFVVRLPAAEREPEPIRASAPANPQSVAGLRVAIVEDGEDSRVMLCELLELAGFQCRTAATGSAGLALIDDFHPDIALIDIGIPEIDGLELARLIRKNPEHAGIHLIALTGYGKREDRDNTQGAGFDDHMVKPVDCDALLRSLARRG
ncbi:MAG TPA: chemotaxis protein CheB [Polyangiaceae bacterium]|nr:chemotaxis protein CheB [Polyangiaceae bacterium]